MKSGREVMKGEMEGKWKIAGISIVVALVASAMMILTVSAALPTRSEKAAKLPGNLSTIYQGEIIEITGLTPNTTVSFYKIDDVEELKFTMSANETGYARRKVSADVAPAGSYNMTYYIGPSPGTKKSAHITIVEPKLKIKIVDKKGEEITSTTIGELIYIDTSELQLPAEDYVKIKHKDPAGHEDTIAEVSVSGLSNYPINTKDWDAGEHSIWIKTVADKSYGLDEASDPVSITMYEREISIEAEKETPVEEEKVLITVRAPPYTWFNFSTNHPEDVVMTDKEKDPLHLKDAGVSEVSMNNETYTIKVDGDRGFQAQTDENGVCKFVVYFTKDRTFTFKVWFNYTDPSVKPTKTWEKTESKARADIDIDVQKLRADIIVPEKAEVGETVTIRVEAPAGHKVDIYIEGRLVENDKRLIDGVAEYDWDTAGETAGTKTIHVYIDCDYSEQYEDDLPEDLREDGSASIRLIAPGLDATQPRNVVARGDDYTVNGNATGVDTVDIIIIGPDGYRGPTEGIVNGLEITDGSVAADNTFSEDIPIPEGADTGRYTVVVLSPGRDGKYGTTTASAGEIEDALVTEYAKTSFDAFLDWLEGSNPAQILDLVKAATINKAGSDDLIVVLYFSVESPEVKLNPVESVPVGEPLNISGTTNREPGTLITITTLEGPTDLPAAMVEVEWPTPDQGIFSATIVTDEAVPGKYVLEADDGEGNTATVEVEILTAVPSPTPSPSPTVSPTPTPTPTPTPSPTSTVSPVAPTTPTPTPTPSPTPPGFEAIFAVAGLLAVTYFVLRRKK